jgi:predicted nuclease of predicted toxin-antitoxin system
MRFLLDQNVPDSVGAALEELGHEVIRAREVLIDQSPDQIVATVAENMDAILISNHYDYRKIAPRIPIGRARFQRLCRIHLRCSEPQAANRIRAAMSFIELEFSQAPLSRVFAHSVASTHGVGRRAT